jgi:hypothetical protein
MEVDLVEEQLLNTYKGAEGRQIQEMLHAVQGTLEATGHNLPPGVIDAAFADILLAPGYLSRAALHAALVHIGCSVTEEAVNAANLVELRTALPSE